MATRLCSVNLFMWFVINITFHHLSFIGLYLFLGVKVRLFFCRVGTDNNKGIFDRVIAEVLHEHGGEDRCPWTRAVMDGTCMHVLML